MSKVLRFENSDFGVELFEFGRYVMHEDYAAIESERDKLAAENAALKDERNTINQANDRQAAYIERLLFVIESEGLSVSFTRQEADTYLAEIRAQAVEDSINVLKLEYDVLDDVTEIVFRDLLEYAASIRAAAKGEGVSDE